MTRKYRSDEQYESETVTVDTLPSLVAGTAGVGFTTVHQGANPLPVENQYSIWYAAAATVNAVVKASAGFVHSVILGKWVTGGTVEISDHASDGDGNVKVFLQAGATDESGFPKTVPVNATFSTGITTDITASQTYVSIIYR